jgi:hypothetical protein
MTLRRHMERARAAELRRDTRQRAMVADRIIEVALEQRRFMQLTGRRDRGLMDDINRLTSQIINLGATPSDLEQIGRRVNEKLAERP